MPVSIKTPLSREQARQLKAGDSCLISGVIYTARDAAHKRLCELAEQGKPFIIIDRYAPTAKTCHVCGHIQDGLRSRTREWVCPHCGSVLAHEENAALNIRNMGLAQFGRQHQETGAFSAVS